MQPSNKIWYFLLIMICVPMFIPMILPDPYSLFGIMAVGIISVLGMKRYANGMAQHMLGSKTGWSCMTCGWNKFTKLGECKRCGSRQRRMQ